VHIGGIFHRDQDVAVATKIARIESTSALGGGVCGGITAAAGRDGVTAASAAAAAAAAAAKNSFAMEVAASPVPEVVVDNTAPAYASLMANMQNLTAAPRLDDGAAQAQQMQAQAQQAQQAEQAQQAQQAQHMCGCSFVLSWSCGVCAAATGFTGVAALAIAELSTTEAFAACMSCLLCRGLLSCAATVLERDQDAWVQRRCSVGRMMHTQLPLDSQVWRRWQSPN
jgi:hypothetical protein